MTQFAKSDKLSSRWVKPSMTIAAFSAVLLFSSACGGPSEIQDTAAPEETVSTSESVAPEENPSATSETTQASPSDETGAIDSIPTTGQVVNNGRGEYLQTTIATDDPSMEYNDAIVGDEAKASFTKEEILEAQQVAVTFIAEETIDSTVQGGTPADFDAWWDKNKGKFHPVQSEAIYAGSTATADTDALVIRSQWRKGYDYEYGSDKIRISEREITPTAVNGNVGPDGSPFLSIVSDVSFTSNMLVDGEPKKETTTGVATYSLLQDKADGNKWKIVGYDTTFKGIPLK